MLEPDGELIPVAANDCCNGSAAPEAPKSKKRLRKRPCRRTLPSRPRVQSKAQAGSSEQKKWTAGPSSVDDVLRWPLIFADSMEAHRDAHGWDYWSAMVGSIQRGIAFSTDYSGIGVPEVAIGHIVDLLEMKSVPAKKGVVLVRACDSESRCRRVLQAHQPEHRRPRCLHGDLLERMSKELASAIDKLLKESDKELQATMRCRAATRLAAKKKMDEKLEGEICKLLKKELARTQRPVVLSAFCYNCKRTCEVVKECGSECGPGPGPTGKRNRSQDPDRLRINVSGICCYDWSSRGQQRGYLGRTAKVLVQWLFERLVGQEDLCIVECTRRFKPSILIKVLGETHDISFCIFNPLEMGFGMSRTRIYVICIRKTSLRWSAPLDFPSTLRCLFNRANIIHGSAFFRAPDSDVGQFMERIADKRNLELPKQVKSGNVDNVYKLLCGSGHRIREGRYLEMARRSTMQLHEDDVDFVCDQSQTPGDFGGVTRHVPSFTTKTEPHSLLLRRPMLTAEKCEAMGLPYYTPDGFEFKNPLKHLVASDEFTSGQWNTMLGNSMHVGAVGAVLMLSLACTEAVV